MKPGEKFFRPGMKSFSGDTELRLTKTESELTREQSTREETMITKNTTRLVLRFLYLFSILWFLYCFKVSRSCEWGMRWVLVSVELISQSLDDPTLRWPENLVRACALERELRGAERRWRSRVRVGSGTPATGALERHSSTQGSKIKVKLTEK